MSRTETISALFHQIMIATFIGVLTRPLIGLIVYLSIAMVLYLIQYGVSLAKKN